MATVTRFEDLEIWKLTRVFAQYFFNTYNKSENFFKDFQWRAQINGSLGLIMDNIAEGFERGSRKEFVNFLSIAKGSACESKSQLYRSLDREYILQEEFNFLYNKVETLSKKLVPLKY